MKNGELLLDVQNVTKKFGGLVAVNDVSIHVGKGEIVGLIGANGAGKTTLFNMIAGAFPVTSGKICFKGEYIENKPSHVICKRGIGRTYQIVKPFQSETVFDNVMVGALLHHPVKEAMEHAGAVCETVGLGAKKDVPGSSLNLPELKRLELARALATEPDLILLDEVMAGLNVADSLHVVELIQRINAETGITFLIIEHVMKAIMTLSHRLYVMNQGTLISEGAPQEVSNDPAVISSYLGARYKNAEN